MPVLPSYRNQSIDLENVYQYYNIWKMIWKMYFNITVYTNY